MTGLPCEVIAVANGCTDHTQSVLLELSNTMPLVRLTLPRPGKSAALNFGMSEARGRLLIFTDDDVIPADNWLATLVGATTSYKKVRGFCGPIHPLYPNGTPTWVREHPFRVPGFAEFAPALPLAQECSLLPFGPNFAIRANARGDLTFRTDLGASEKNGALSCEDVDFTMRFRNAWGPFWFLPGAAINHRVRPEQLTIDWLLERSFLFGKSVRTWMAPPAAFHPPFWAVPEPGQMNAFDKALVHNFFLGQFAHCIEVGLDTRPLVNVLRRIPSFTNDVAHDFLSKSALHLYNQNREHFYASP
jgi:glycosyltransferase involved in cell wall biosynthesis